MVTTPNLTSNPPYTGMPPVVTDQPILALSLKTFGLGGAPNPPALNTGVTTDAFQKTNSTASAGGDPQQQLQAAYQQAEEARNKYLQLANQLNSNAYQNQLPANTTLPGGSVGQPAGFQPSVADPNQAQQQMQQMQQQLQLQQQAELAQQQQVAEQARLQAEQQLQQQQMQQTQAAAAQQNQNPQLPPTQQPPQAPIDPTQQLPQPPAPQDLSFASLEELNGMITQAQTIQDKVNAMAELSVRGQGNPATYEILKREAGTDTSLVPPGPAQQQANYARQTALWTLGIMNAMQNAAAPTAQLPGLGLIDQLVSDPKTDPSVQIAGIQALQVLNRSQDPVITQILKKAKKGGTPDVKARAESALAGEVIPLPSQPQAQPQPPSMPVG